ncbi:hypothetical protein [Cupriavidus sp. D39]|uniref:hypothetical protein n=1 Tax=Cupriavidus sp. D39 TaxID=2997877 RepID=UPI00226F5C42|nr:hypothetical protein [Cupriavidus sp. D39]MCY0853547.1 hypothetical protein [Cupriavidus sp. D39]
MPAVYRARRAAAFCALACTAAISVRRSASACFPFLAQRALLIDLVHRAALGGAGLLRDGDLLARAFQLRRELDTQLIPLPLERLGLALALLLTRLRGRVGLALGVQLFP